MSEFQKLHFHADVQDAPESERAPERLRGALRSTEPDAEAAAAPRSADWNDEKAARHYIESFLAESKKPGVRGLTAPERPQVVPDLRLEATKESPLTGTRVVEFSQTSRSVPIFGSKATVEIDGRDRRLVAIDANVAAPPDVPAVASTSPAHALDAIAKACDADRETLADVAAPELNYFLDQQKGNWHLVFYFRNVPAIPPAEEQESRNEIANALGRTPRAKFEAYDFLVDAHTGQLVYYFSSSAFIDVPVVCTGTDELGKRREFYGLGSGTGFELRDPLRGIETYDHQFNDIDAATLPNDPIDNASTDFGTDSTAGVSAHSNATRVFDFFNNVLKRNGIDDKGMIIVSLVNVTYAKDQPPPNWRNACWWNGKMWYGQEKSNGGFESLSRYLDIIAHELSHGVTATTSDLVYRDQSGALNESFSDIFGIMIKNWFPGEPNPLANWDWEIGSGFRPTGLPLRDMSDPKRTGHPDHMNDYLYTTGDYGGVHTNCTIHNKAAYNVLTSRDGSGNPVCTPTEVAIFYYLTLTRLNRMATFSDCLRMLKSVAATYYSGNPGRQAATAVAIDAAYQGAGIT